MKIQHFYLFILQTVLLGSVVFPAQARTKNAGLGPLEVRTQYPLTQQFLVMFPENTATLKAGETRFSYGTAFANTFTNTQGATKQITKTEAANGITLNDFLDENGNKVNGFSLYLDVESMRQTLRLKNGWSDSVEFSLEVPFLSFNGGGMDSLIESVHSAIGVRNSENSGAYRSLSEKNQYAYYVVRDNATIYGSSQPFSNIRGEPSVGLKWKFTEGGKTMPAIALKLSYKFADSERNGEQKLARSGGSDRGYYLILSKGFGDWVVYFGDGMTTVGENRGFADFLKHRFMAMEYRTTEESSIVLQTVSQSSIYPTTNTSPRTTAKESQEQRNFSLNTPTGVAVLGYKSILGPLFWETGFVQDYSNFGNETDFVLFLEMGVQW